MKKSFCNYNYSTVLLFSVIATGQTTFNQYKAGNVFDIAVPDYMTRTIGLNDVATVQYKNSVNDIYTIVEDSKRMAIAAIFYASIQEFQEEFEKDFIKDEEKKEQVVNHYLQQKK
jgi:hypothetical protein